MADPTQHATSAQHTTPSTSSTNNIANGSPWVDASPIPARHKPGPKPGTAAARRGGTAVREKYGLAFFRSIGVKGGATVRDRHGFEFYHTIGQLGGETTKQRLGSEHYARIGRIGAHRAHRARSMHGAEGTGTTTDENVTR